MVEAMACGTPVLAMPGGSVPEVVRQGTSGYICRSVVEMAKRARDLKIDPLAVRKYVEDNFSIQQMADGYRRVYEDALRDPAGSSLTFIHPGFRLSNDLYASITEVMGSLCVRISAGLRLPRRTSSTRRGM
jgi:hypothetical protein